LFSVITSALPFNPFWTIWLIFCFRRHQPDVVVGSDIRAGLTAILAASLVGLPIVTDIRENHSKLVKFLDSDSLLDRIIQNPWLVTLLERIVYQYSDEVWVVTEERIQDIPIDDIARDKIEIVSNTPNLEEIRETRRHTKTGPAYKWPGFSLVYVGVLNRFRGLDLILEAVAMINARQSDEIHLAIAGDGPHKSEIEAYAETLGITDRVSFVGWIDSTDVPRFLDSGDVGIIPHKTNEFTNTTIPNKLFDSMCIGQPVLATDMDPVRRVIEETDCGYIIPSDADAETIAEMIVELRDASNLDEMGSDGRRAIEQRYNWQQDFDHALRSLERAAQQ
jgi:glycosyltransferase involved in cell wall biosynthesis